MATIKICDRCGAVIQKGTIKYSLVRNEVCDLISEKELCESCSLKLIEWLKPVIKKEDTQL